GSVPLHRVHGPVGHLLQDGGRDFFGHFRRGQAARRRQQWCISANNRQKVSMNLVPFLLGALLAAAPVFSQQVSCSDPLASSAGPKWFQLAESESDVRKCLGQPTMVADFGRYRSWQYQIGEVEHDDFSHALIFRKSDGKLVSVTRSYNPERNVDVF